MNKLVIVESPGKIKKITEYLGPNYLVKASFGHCLDLDKKTLSIDIDNNFAPNYVISEDKIKVVNELKNLAKNMEVILASDEDREGEAIAYSLKNILNLRNPKRIVFHEITKKAIKEAVENPREIDMDMVYAQQARRLLDRLVGYKISPLLWKHLNVSGVQSAGRVQSVVLKIINLKEEEINNSINTAYFKTTIILLYKKNKINGTLTKTNSDNIYKFDSLENAEIFLKKINSDTIFKIIYIDNKKSFKKPPPPFITSSLQQEASTKLHFGVQKTMQIAQKLYEEGLITYMRTDSTCLSNDAITNCKNYIISNFGELYSKPNPYNINKSNAQEAHEAIRPTNIDTVISNNLNTDCIKLYNLILKRTIASQMAPAEFDIQIIKVDTINNNISILIELESLWIATFEILIFEGFLKIYNDSDTCENSKKLDLIKDQTLVLDSIKITEEYTKLPLRYNEANLVKYLEKHSIGRPSTYASIINKVLERKYVEIKDIEGIKKNSQQLELNKKYKITCTTKENIIGKETKKIIPTKLGQDVNNFMTTNFSSIIEIEFTSEFEKYLDMIAEGKAKWYNILDKFYKIFNPIIIELTSSLINVNKSSDTLIMRHPETNIEIYAGCGKYGDYIKFLDENNKWKYISTPNKNITKEEILELIKYPKYIGKYNKKSVYLHSGKYGYYIKYNNKNIAFNQDDYNKITIEYCKKLLDIPTLDTQNTNKFIIENTIINVKIGQYGPYLQLVNNKNKILKNISIPKHINLTKITVNEIKSIIENN